VRYAFVILLELERPWRDVLLASRYRQAALHSWRTTST
jgi:hypothetical protein